jgi:hypothetical protein
MVHSFLKHPLLNYFKSPKLWTDGYFYFFRLTAAVLVIYGGIQAYEAGINIAKFTAIGIFGGIVFELLFCAAILQVAYLLWRRAQGFKKIKHDSLMFLRAGARALRTCGETFGIFFGIYTFASGLLYWFAGSGAARIIRGTVPLYPMQSYLENNFVHGLFVMAAGFLWTFLWASGALLAAQVLLVVTSMGSKLHHDISEEEKRDAA